MCVILIFTSLLFMLRWVFFLFWSEQLRRKQKNFINRISYRSIGVISLNTVYSLENIFVCYSFTKQRKRGISKIYAMLLYVVLYVYIKILTLIQTNCVLYRLSQIHRFIFNFSLLLYVSSKTRCLLCIGHHKWPS